MIKNSLIKHLKDNNQEKLLLELDKLLLDYTNVIIIADKQILKDKSILKIINETKDYTAYGIFPDGKGSYESLDNLYKQIINLSKIDTKKIIYIYNIENIDQNIILENIKNSLIIINSHEKIIEIKKKENIDEGVIREAKFNDYSKVKKLTDTVKDINYKQRKDLFINVVVYTQQEFHLLTQKYDDKLCLVYELDNEIIGLIEAQIVNTRDNRKLREKANLIIKNIIVKEEYRRKKIGTKLYNELLKFAKKRRVDNIKISTYYFNEDLIKFIESIDMKELSREYILTDICKDKK